MGVRGAALISIVAGFGLAAGVAAIAQEAGLPDASGKQQILTSCTRCHGVDVIVAQPRSPDEWAEVVSVMVGHGAALTDDEYERVVAYLSTNLAPREASSN